jgi:hypothetical protein
VRLGKSKCFDQFSGVYVTWPKFGYPVLTVFSNPNKQRIESSLQEGKFPDMQYVWAEQLWCKPESVSVSGTILEQVSRASVLADPEANHPTCRLYLNHHDPENVHGFLVGSSECRIECCFMPMGGRDDRSVPFPPLAENDSDGKTWKDRWEISHSTPLYNLQEFKTQFPVKGWVREIPVTSDDKLWGVICDEKGNHFYYELPKKGGV